MINMTTVQFSCPEKWASDFQQVNTIRNDLVWTPVEHRVRLICVNPYEIIVTL